MDRNYGFSQLFAAVKMIISIIMMGFFAYSVYYGAQKFSENKTMVQSWSKTIVDMPIPDITICSKQPYKNISGGINQLKDFMANTKDIHGSLLKLVKYDLHWDEVPLKHKLKPQIGRAHV